MDRMDTQRKKIREHLLDGNSITAIEALELCGCFRLAAVIHRIKNSDNIPVKTMMVSDGKKRFARYYLEA